MSDFINKKLNLAKEIEYSADSVVSKAIYTAENNILTLFALAKEQSIAEHLTPFDAMVTVIDGEARIVIGGKDNILVAGESIIMPTNIPHALYADKEFKMLLTMMKG